MAQCATPYRLRNPKYGKVLTPMNLPSLMRLAVAVMRVLLAAVRFGCGDFNKKDDRPPPAIL